MGTEWWSTDGYGIKVSDLNVRNNECILNLMCLRTGLYDYVCEKADCYDDDKLSQMDTERLMNLARGYDFNSEGGLAGLLYLAIAEQEGIQMTAIRNYMNEEYLIYEPKYPWENITKKEQALTPNTLIDILNRYMDMVSDNRAEIDILSVVDCG